MTEKIEDLGPIQLHPRGDAILVVHHEVKPSRKWLVSSCILGAASPYFKGLLNSDFKEGQAVRSGQCPEITLEEDDPDAMDIILSCLHFKNTATSLTLQVFTSVAIHSDKYNCGQALTAWVSLWYRELGTSLDSRDLETLLSAAYLFRQPDVFENASKNFLRHSTICLGKEQDASEIMCRLPDNLQGRVGVGVATNSQCPLADETPI
jgi:hypothetical protein